VCTVYRTIMIERARIVSPTVQNPSSPADIGCWTFGNNIKPLKHDEILSWRYASRIVGVRCKYSLIYYYYYYHSVRTKMRARIGFIVVRRSIFKFNIWSRGGQKEDGRCFVDRIARWWWWCV